MNATKEGTPGGLPQEEARKFRQVTYHQFFSKAVYILSVLIIIEIVLLYITMFSKSGDFAYQRIYYLCYYAATIVGLSILLAVCGDQRRKRPEELRDLGLDVAIGFALMLAFISVVLFNQRLEGVQSNYLLGLMFFARLVRVPMRKSIILYGVIQLVYIGMLFAFLDDRAHILFDIVNAMIFTVAAASISFILFRQDQQFFNQNLIILEQNEQLYRLSYLDPVLRIYNRRYLFETGSLLLSRSQLTRTSFAVIMLDIDGFKEYNDRYGHPAGDECLAVLGSIIRDNTQGENCFGARYGGEEITVVALNQTLDAVTGIAEGLRRQLYDHNIRHETAPCGKRLTISAGAAVFTPDALPGLNMDTAILYADNALYEAKKRGRNRICVHEYPVPQKQRQEMRG